MKRVLALACAGSLSWACGSPPDAQAPPPAAQGASDSPAAEESFRARPPEAGPAAALSYPRVQHAVLANGVQVYLVARDAGTVALTVSARVGAALDPADQSGLAAFTVRALTEGTRRLSALELAVASEDLGASLAHDTGRDGSSLSLEVLAEDADRALALLSEVALRPGFSPEALQRVRKQWLDDLASERQSPRRLSSLAALRALLGPDAGAPVTGRPEHVQRFAREHLVAFHRSHFVPENLAVIAAGPLTLPRLTEMAERHFGGLPRVAPPKPRPGSPSPALESTRVLVVDRPGAVQSAIFAIQHFPTRREPGHEARLLMNDLLGGLFTSRLNQNLREKHAFTYGVRSFPIDTQHFGALAIMTDVKTETTGDALAQIVLELAALKAGTPRPVEAEELARARADLIERAASSLEHVSHLRGDAVELFIDELPLDYHARFPARLADVTQADVAREAQRLTPEQLVVVVVGDSARVTPALESGGFSVSPAPPQLVE